MGEGGEEGEGKGGRGREGRERGGREEGEGRRGKREGPQVTVEPGPLRALLRYCTGSKAC